MLKQLYSTVHLLLGYARALSCMYTQPAAAGRAASYLLHAERKRRLPDMSAPLTHVRV